MGSYVALRYYVLKTPYYIAPFKVLRVGVFFGVGFETVLYLRKIEKEQHCNLESLNELTEIDKKLSIMRHASDFEGVMTENYFKNFYRV